MKRTLYVPMIMFVFAFAAVGQKLVKPTKMSSPATAAQEKLIQEGIKLHDSKDYDGAVAKYQQVLTENPDCTLAMYEMALSFYTKGDTVKAMETAYRGSAYISDELALFYATMANCLDDVGKPDEAIKIYREAEDILKGYPNLKHHLASTYYNLGVTYAKLSKYPEAKVELKKAVETNYAYASPHYLLSVIYQTTKYKVPGFLAAARFVPLEFNTPRTAKSAAVITNALKPAPKDPKTGNMSIVINMDAPKDEGDYSMYELFLGTMTTVKTDKDKNKSENEIFADAVDTLIALIAEDKKLASTFVGKNYVPFVAEMKAKGFVKPFAYLVLYSTGNADALTWIKANNDSMVDMVNWARTYKLPSK